jgi:stage V sporulation protein R
MYTDLKRICEKPTPEDRHWFPSFAGSAEGKDPAENAWLPTLDYAMRNFKDESFIGQFLSPKVMRDFRLFAIHDDEDDSEMEVAAIHDELGYRNLREMLARQYDLSSREPNIQVWSVNLRGDRSMVLRHTQHNSRPLSEGTRDVLKHMGRLWGFPVHLESVDRDGHVRQQWTVVPEEAGI